LKTELEFELLELELEIDLELEMELVTGNIFSYNFTDRNLRSYYAISDGKLSCSTNNKRQ
ncbi:hypothetical protein T11_115, partial [Trichinella zimbabwensis]